MENYGAFTGFGNSQIIGTIMTKLLELYSQDKNFIGTIKSRIIGTKQSKLLLP